jgi:murein L,D-transpeptidase YcbB/YkuD
LLTNACCVIVAAASRFVIDLIIKNGWYFIKVKFMTLPAIHFFYLVKVFFLLLCFSTQANASWGTQSSLTLEQLLKSNPQQLQELNEPAVVDFYRERKHEPLWSDAKGRLDRAYDLLHILIHADDEGLEPSDYYLKAIKKYWDTKAPRDSIQLDLLLSAALYRYSNDVYSGRYKPRDMDADWHIKNDVLDSHRLFADVAMKQSITPLLKSLPHQHSDYQSLKKQLRLFRDLERQGDWEKFKSGPTLEPGMQHKQVAQLRQRFKITHDLDEGSLHDISIFDRPLAEAVKRYQSRHGLTADGRVGPQTRRTLNIPPGERIRQIRINMERWRWLPRKLGKQYLMVNMTGFELYIVDNDATVLSMPVIIGKSYRSTPSFSGMISTMEYNPYWTIPTNMAVEDFVPRQKNDPSFFERKSIKLFRGWKKPREIDPKTVDWSGLNKENFPYWLRQEPGPKNALGRVKFLFSNPYEIYLHGTPDKHLFERAVRAFSSGCIRVKDPVRLAAYLLNDGTQLMEEEILANIHLGSNQSIQIPISVPIYLVYWTAWVDQDGGINFRPDIYNRDTKLYKMFNN